MSCSVSYVFVKELAFSLLQFVWPFSTCSFLPATFVASSPLRQLGVRPPTSPTGGDTAHSSCPCRNSRHLGILRPKGAHRLTLVLVAPACSLSTSLQFRQQVGVHVRSDCRSPPRGHHSQLAHQGQGPSLRHGPDVRAPLGDIQYRAAIADVNWLLTAKVSPCLKSLWVLRG